MFIKLYGIITISLWWFQNVIFLKHKQNSETTDININDKQKVKTEYNQNNNGFENIITYYHKREPKQKQKNKTELCFSSFMPFWAHSWVTLYIHSGRTRRTVVNTMLLYSWRYDDETSQISENHSSVIHINPLLEENGSNI